ncbi:MAG: PqqD family protein [Nocardioides sp.]|uniref:PqqD family protein n=1 Tax=Nocardioides sp. TaxID=35761 RepID=UPI0039E30512
MIERNPLAVFTRVGDTIAVLDETSEPGELLELSGIGAEIWERLATPIGEADLIDGLGADFGVDPAVVGADVRPFLADLSARGLLVASES